MSYQRLAGIGGIVFVVLGVTLSVIPIANSFPPDDASIQKISSYYENNKDAVKAGVSMALVVWPALLLFVSGVFLIVQPMEQQRQEAWSILALLGIAVQSAVFIVVISTQAAFALRADTILANPGATEALWGLQRAALSIDGAGLVAALVGLAMGTFRAGVAPKWHSAIGVSGGLILLAGHITVHATPDGGAVGIIPMAGFILWLVWILIMAIKMVLTPSSARG